VVESVAYLPPAGKILVSAGYDNTIRFWDLKTGRQRIRLDVDERIMTMAVSPDGKLLAANASSGSIILWDIEKNRETSRLTGHTDSVWNVRFSADSRSLASVNRP